MFNLEVCKKIVYAIEQASAARHPFGGKPPAETIEPLDVAIDALRAALIEAANAE